jgi:hypothetical protein
MFDKSVIVFGKKCLKVTSDEEIDNLGHDVALVHRYNISIYVNKDDLLIEVIYDNNRWSIRIDDLQGESYSTLHEAQEDIRNRSYKNLQHTLQIHHITLQFSYDDMEP